MFGTRTERKTKLWQYAQRRPLPYDKTKEEKIAQHSRNSKRSTGVQLRFDNAQQQLKMHPAFPLQIATSVKQCPLGSLRSLKQGKAAHGNLQQLLIRPMPGQLLRRQSLLLSTTPTSSNSKSARKAPDYFGFKSSVCTVSDIDSVPAPKRPKQINPVIKTVIQEEALLSPAAVTSFEMPVVSPPAPQPIGSWSPDEYNYEDYERVR